MGDIYIGTSETDAVQKIAKAYRTPTLEFIFIFPAGMASTLPNKPLILSQQEDRGGRFSQRMKQDTSSLNIIATYNLLFNASLMVEEGLGYAVGLDKIINIGEDSPLCFRPLYPVLENEISIIWKKYQIFSKHAGKFIGIRLVYTFLI